MFKIQKKLLWKLRLWVVAALVHRSSFEKIDGVKQVVSGYAGGKIPNPTYKQICSGLTGHAEVIKIIYDPQKITFENSVISLEMLMILLLLIDRELMLESIPIDHYVFE